MPPKLGAALDELLDRTIVPSYTRLGYALRRSTWDDSDLDVDLTGQVCIVTGASSGLGRSTAEGLASRGARVYMLVRNPSKGEAVRAGIELRTGSGDVHLAVVDLSNQRSVREGVARFLSKESRLDLLINNAGVLLPERVVSVDGIEMTLATNVLGPFLLTSLLLPQLQACAPARIINVSSGGMYTQKLDVEDLQFERKSYSGPRAYAQAKRALVILTELWAEKLDGSGITVNAMHPGWVDTPGVQTSLPRFHRIVGGGLRTPQQGADTILWLAVAQRLTGQSGKFWFDRRPRPTHLLRRTQSTVDDRHRLWAMCMHLCGLADPDPPPRQNPAH